MLKMYTPQTYHEWPIVRFEHIQNNVNQTL